MLAHPNHIVAGVRRISYSTGLAGAMRLWPPSITDERAAS